MPLAPHRQTVAIQQAALSHGNARGTAHAGEVSNKEASTEAEKPLPSAPLLSEAVETYDLVIIGSGPAGLATLARALETRPGALYTDEERRHLHWLQRTSRSPSTLLHAQWDKNGEKRAVRPNGATEAHPKDNQEGNAYQPEQEHNGMAGCAHISRPCPCPRVLVIDKSGKGWAGQYHSLMDAYEIKFLRSPMFFHPSPGDHDDLLAFAARIGWNVRASPSQIPMGQGGHAPINLNHTAGSTSAPLVSRRMRRTQRAVQGVEDASGAVQPHLMEISGIVGTGLSKHRRKKLSKKSRASTPGQGPSTENGGYLDDAEVAEEMDSQGTSSAKVNSDSAQKRALGVNVNERAREDFFAPSTPLFFRFCDEDIIQRLGIPSGFPQEVSRQVVGAVHDEENHNVHPQKGRFSRRAHQKQSKASSRAEKGEQAHPPGSQETKQCETKLWPLYEEVLSQKESAGDSHTRNSTSVTLARGSVEDLAWYEDGACGCSPFNSDTSVSGAFALRLDSGYVISTSAVVSAVGPGGMPNVPPALIHPTSQKHLNSEPLEGNKQNAKDQDEFVLSSDPDNADPQAQPGAYPSGEEIALGNDDAQPKAKSLDPWNTPSMGLGWCHSLVLANPNCTLPPPHVKRRMSDPLRSDPTTLLVVGGGLTSAQIVDMCLRHNYFDRVHLTMRGPLKCKPIDVGHEWLGKFANLHKMRFWQEDSAQMRWEMIRDARNGGCVTPNYARVLAFWQQTGRLQVHQFTTLESFHWDAEQSKAKCRLFSKHKVFVDGPNRKSGKGSRRRRSSQPESDSDDDTSEPVKDSSSDEAMDITLQVDYVVSATGQAASFASLPFTRRLLSTNPIPVINGLPLVNEDLQWSPDIPFFTVGAYAALQVGPGSFNLIGIREGADRIAVRLGELAAASEDDSVPEEAEAAVISPVAGASIHNNSSRFTHFGFELLGEA